MVSLFYGLQCRECLYDTDVVRLNDNCGIERESPDDIMSIPVPSIFFFLSLPSPPFISISICTERNSLSSFSRFRSLVALTRSSGDFLIELAPEGERRSRYWRTLRQDPLHPFYLAKKK